jgi:hypothetical protein
MARTRSKPTAKSTETEDTTQSTKPSLRPSDQNPPKLFVLPKDVSKDARIVSIPNPATSNPNRYYHCPENGIYEFVKVAAPRSVPRSLLFTSKRSEEIESQDTIVEKPDETKPAEEEGKTASTPKDAFCDGYITRSADMFIATPIDLIFFLLPILSPLASKGQKQMFLTFDDHVDKISGSFKQLFQQAATRKLFEKRLPAICDTVEAGDETLFRLSVEKLAKEVASKAEVVVKKGLPPSMDERFVRQALRVPVLNIAREDSGVTFELDNATVAGAEATPQVPSIVLDESSQTPDPSQTAGETQLSVESQQSVATSQTSVHTSSTLLQNDMEAPENIINLLRLQTAINYISTSYLPSHLRRLVQKALEDSNIIDFAPLTAHMQHLETLREKARALRSLSDNISRKRPAENDDEAIEARAEKKRKKEEEEKNKKQASRALKNLKKVDTSGMKKMSSFFMKAPKK